ncbi:MAG: hypothetical protein MI919_42315, partial [Holophagales bacterium]|nr:hypothetical protein [Holophagales bacterium]
MFRKIFSALLPCWLLTSLFTTLPALADSPPRPPDARGIPARLADQIQALKLGLVPPESPWLSTLPRGGVGTFDAGGLRLAGDGDGTPWELSLRLGFYGRQGAMLSVSGGRLHASEQRAELDHGALREWMQTAGADLSHGIVLRRPPYRITENGQLEAGSGELLFELEASGTFEARLRRNGEAVVFRDGPQTWVLHQLRAFDADGDELPARLELTDRGPRLRVDDLGAPYPLTLASDVTQIRKLLQPSAQFADNAGLSVAIDGDFAVVGAVFADEPWLINAGKAYIFQRDLGGPENWGLLKEIGADEPWLNANFGHAVAISGDYILVGAQNFDEILIPLSGRAFLFERNAGGLDNWGQIKRFSNPDPVGGDLFGFAVDIDADTVAISAFADNIFVFPLLLLNAGQVFVYQRDQGGPGNWGQVKLLQSSDPQLGGHFGQSLALDGDTLVVGALTEDVEGLDDGAAYVFERNQGGANAWGLVKQLQANDGSAFDRFGDDVAIDGDTLVVGADYADNGVLFSDSGAAYVFERNAGGAGFWGQTAKLVSSDRQPADHFGGAVAIEGDAIFVGAHGDNSPSLDAGSAYLFRRDQGGPGAWGEVAEFASAAPMTGDDFGISIDVNDGTVLVGARFDREVAFHAGAAYIFQLTPITDLAISLDATPDPVTAGGTVTYTVTVTNLGTEDAPGVLVTHLFTPDGGFGSTTSGCIGDPFGSWVCGLGIVAAGASVQYTLTRPVDAGASGSLGFTASVGSGVVDPMPANDSVTRLVLVGGGGPGSANLALSKSDSSDPIAPGATLTYTLTVDNNGPDEAVNVVVTETMPAGLSGVATSGCAEDGAGVPTCTLGNILPGFSKSYTIQAQVDAAAGQTLINQASVTSDTPDPITANNSVVEETDVGAGIADLSIDMEEDTDPIQAGDPLVYTVNVTNLSAGPAPDVQVSFTLPAGVTLPTSSGCAEDPAGIPTCSLGTIAGASTKQFTVSMQTDGVVPGVLTAIATVTSSALEPNPANNTTVEATTVDAPGDVDLWVFQTDSTDPVEPETALTYTIYVGNRGPSTAQNVQLAVA